MRQWEKENPTLRPEVNGVMISQQRKKTSTRQRRKMGRVSGFSGKQDSFGRDQLVGGWGKRRSRVKKASSVEKLAVPIFKQKPTLSKLEKSKTQCRLCFLLVRAS